MNRSKYSESLVQLILLRYPKNLRQIRDDIGTYGVDAQPKMSMKAHDFGDGTVYDIYFTYILH